MKTVLLLDVETTGLDFNKDRIIEIGAQLTNDTFDFPIQTYQAFTYASDYPEVSEEIFALTGIDKEEYVKDRQPIAVGLEGISKVAALCDYVIAYNKDFDKGMFEAEVKRELNSLIPGTQQLIDMPWLCAMKDVESNYSKKCWKLSHLALDYGLPVDPRTLHRAVDDVDLMRRMLNHIGTSATQIYEFSQEPWIHLVATTKPPWTDNGKSNELAKQMGFRFVKEWELNKSIQNAWMKSVKRRHVEKIVSDSIIKITEVKPWVG